MKDNNNMPSGFWDYIHLGRSRTNNCDDEQGHHNLQEGLFQIATQTCNILVQVNNTNNINVGPSFNYKDFDTKQFGECSTSVDLATKKALFDLEQSVVLLQPKEGKLPATPTKVRFSRLSEYRRRLSVSHDLLVSCGVHSQMSLVENFERIFQRPQFSAQGREGYP